jgi:hypothetical protein
VTDGAQQCRKQKPFHGFGAYCRGCYQTGELHGRPSWRL